MLIEYANKQKAPEGVIELEALSCHRHEGTNYVTRPWGSDKSNTWTKTGMNYVTCTWASDKGDFQIYEEIQPHLSHSSVAKELDHLPIGEWYSQTEVSDQVKRNLVTKVSEGPEVAKCQNNSRPGQESIADIIVDNIRFKATGLLSRISARK